MIIKYLLLAALLLCEVNTYSIVVGPLTTLEELVVISDYFGPACMVSLSVLILAMKDTQNKLRRKRMNRIDNRKKNQLAQTMCELIRCMQ